MFLVWGILARRPKAALKITVNKSLKISFVTSLQKKSKRKELSSRLHTCDLFILLQVISATPESRCGRDRPYTL